MYIGEREAPILELKIKTKAFKVKDTCLIISTANTFAPDYLYTTGLIHCKKNFQTTGNYHPLIIMHLGWFENVMKLIKTYLTRVKRRHQVFILHLWLALKCHSDSTEAHTDKLIYLLYMLKDKLRSSNILNNDKILSCVGFVGGGFER